MSGYTTPSRDESAVQTVRTIARVAQMLIELRDEYIERPREDLLEQIEQRLGDLQELRIELKSRLDHVRVED
jgi:hypothetical protein